MNDFFKLNRLVFAVNQVHFNSKKYHRLKLNMGTCHIAKYVCLANSVLRRLPQYLFCIYISYMESKNYI